jgi:hypothetical protein
MARKGGAPRDRFINRYRGTVVMPADSTTGIWESFNTGMNVGRENPTKWVITHFAVWPGAAAAFPVVEPYGATQLLKAQLCIGTQAAFLQSDDMQVICDGAISEHFTTSGGWVFYWPLQGFLPSPIPVFAQMLTVGIRSAVNDPGIAGETFVYEIGYVTSPIAQDEIVEYLSAFGQI